MHIEADSVEARRFAAPNMLSGKNQGSQLMRPQGGGMDQRESHLTRLRNRLAFCNTLPVVTYGLVTKG